MCYWNKLLGPTELNNEFLKTTLKRSKSMENEEFARKVGKKESTGTNIVGIFQNRKLFNLLAGMNNSYRNL